MNNDNKYTYFGVSIDIPHKYSVDIDKVKQNISNKIDLVLYDMNASSDIAIFHEINNRKVIYYFKSSKRKRYGQLVRLMNKHLPNYSYDSDHLTKKGFINSIQEFKANNLYLSKMDSSLLQNNIYRANDLEVFKINKLYPWQKYLKDNLYNPPNSKRGSYDIKNGDTRTIIHIYDEAGNNGKSSFVKYLIYLDMVGLDFDGNKTLMKNQIGAFSIGSSSQLKAAAYNMGPKKMYLIDLPRSINKDLDIPSLMGSLEMLKNGSILGVNMYGAGNSLLFEPPIIVLFSNYLLDFDSLSPDRWDTFKINSKTRSLDNITKKLARIHIKNKRRKLRLKRFKNAKKLLVTSR